VVEGKGGASVSKEVGALHLGGIMKVCLSQEQANEVLDLCNAIAEEVPCLSDDEKFDENCPHCQAGRIASYLFDGGLELRQCVKESIKE